MSQRSFQEAMARMVVDSGYRDMLRASDDSALAGDFTPLERKRLKAIAIDPGLGATRMLYKGFRLSKIYATLPLTCSLLGKRRLGREIELFWTARTSVSLYFFDEAFGFCDHLEDRLRKGLRVSYLRDVLKYERACLELRRPRGDHDTPLPQVVKFQHDPEVLLNCLTQGKKPRSVPVQNSTLVGDLNNDGEVQWHYVSESAKSVPNRARAKRSRGFTTMTHDVA